MKNVFKRIAGGALALTLLTGAVAGNTKFTNYKPLKSTAASWELKPISNSIKSIPIRYVGHVQSKGWQNIKKAQNNEYIGTVNEAKRLEAFLIEDDDLWYQVQYADTKNVGLTTCGVDSSKKRLSDHPENNMAGTTGQARAIQAIRIFYPTYQLGYNKYSIFYRVHIQGKGWLNWASNGQIAGNGYGARIEAIQIKKVPIAEYTTEGAINEKNPNNEYAYYEALYTPQVRYSFNCFK